MPPKRSDNEKKIVSNAQLIRLFFLTIVFISILEGVWNALRSGQWSSLIFLLLFFVLMGLILTRSWRTLLSRRHELREKLEQALNNETFRAHKEEYRRKVENSGGEIRIQDAALFSLTWSLEILRSIPPDRKPFVKTAFILIGGALLLLFALMGFANLFPMLLAAALVLAGVNLLIWVVVNEREEKARLQVELETARKMQLSLMPLQDPLLPGYDISGLCIPARDVGGDHFDYVWLDRDNGQFGVAVVDVSGKGLDAAMTAVYTSGAFISEVQHEKEVENVISNLNTVIRSRQNRGRFVSFLILALDVRKRRIRYVNAGQSRPMLLRDGQVEILRSNGARFPLGTVKDARYQASPIDLRSGDKLLLYTDGVSDAMNREQQMFGEERLKQSFQRLAVSAPSARALVEELKAEIMAFSNPDEQYDDLTIVVIDVLPLELTSPPA